MSQNNAKNKDAKIEKALANAGVEIAEAPLELAPVDFGGIDLVLPAPVTETAVKQEEPKKPEEPTLSSLAITEESALADLEQESESTANNLMEERLTKIEQSLAELQQLLGGVNGGVVSQAMAQAPQPAPPPQRPVQIVNPPSFNFQPMPAAVQWVMPTA